MKIVLVGDSTVNDEGGWGEGFRATLIEGISPPPEVINLAKNGRSSKSFRDEGLWAPALAAKPDFILIQFGHNDEPGKGPERETGPTTTYRANMIRYVEEARAAGATPILVTSIVRRNFNPDGKIKRDHMVPYVEEAGALAEAIREVKERIVLCEVCFNLADEPRCRICQAGGSGCTTRSWGSTTRQSGPGCSRPSGA